MLNTKKLLYILPDVAYVAELLPAKKEHTFSIQAFRQINGEFLNEDDLIAENIEKLFSKLEPDQYHVILPDFLFTNTIIEVQETAEAKVMAHLKEKLLPSLDLDKSTHQIDTFIVTQHQGKSKVQLSAIEKTAVAPITSSAQAHKIAVTGICALTWTVKSVVSLEPSITVIQVGSNLYVGLHYIGLDQTTMSRVEELENVAETIKTLKGGEPSIQTVYLLTNELVADRLKENVSATLPLQQLATFKEDETQMPSYVKQIIESGMKTLDIKEYQVPVFDLPKGGMVNEVLTESKSAVDEPNEPIFAETNDTEETSDDEIELPKPTPVAGMVAAATVTATPLATASAATSTAITTTSAMGESLEDIGTTDTTIPATDQATGLEADAVEAADISETPEDDDSELDDDGEIEEVSPAVAPVAKPVVTPEPEIVSAPVATKPEPELEVQAAPLSPASPPPSTTAVITDTIPTMNTSSEPNLSQFASPTHTDINISATQPSPSQTKTVIKNKSGVNGMLKMVFVTLAVFFATVGIGVGIGFGILSLTNRPAETTNNDTITPVAITSPTPVASTTPTATPQASTSPTATDSAAVQRKEMSVLVVNATTIAGHAGKTKAALDKAGYQKVAAGNAKGEYEAGVYVLMAEKNDALISTLTEDTSLELEYQATATIEDPKGEYDAIIVLAE
ncbi:MAG TPA: LytR C-terminal domain-containing protein [Vitreimonas sp.]|nr:LytR C-terminal domain-containing protein [Vitreimonas sp.]